MLPNANQECNWNYVGLFCALPRASLIVDFTFLTSCMLAVEKVARKDKDEDDDDDQHHDEDDVQVHGG